VKNRGLALSLLLLALACGQTKPEPAAPPRELPPLAASYVFGQEPEGGQLVLGVLLRWEDPRVVADALPKDVFEKFVQEEAARADQDDEEIEEPEPEWVEDFASIASRYATVAADVAKQLGVQVLLREITIEELGQAPVVVLYDTKLTAVEDAQVAAYRSAGGITVVAPSPEKLLAACQQALRESPRVHRLDSDPTELVKASRTEDFVMVRFATAPTDAQYVDSEGQVQWQDAGNATLQIPAPLDHLSLMTNRLVLSWRIDGLTLRRAWSLADLVGVVDREIETAQRAVLGGRIAFRARYKNSLTHLAVAGQTEEIKLLADGVVLSRTTATSDADGILQGSLPVPDDASPGAMELDFGDVKLPLQVRRDLRVSIVTDRALYRPTDTVHARVLVRHAPSGRAATNASISLTHSTPRGRAAQRAIKTSEHGIASWSLSLVDADAGRHSVRVFAGNASATADFNIEAFEKPLFTFRLDPDHLELRSGESAPVELRAKFFNGAPMAGADVTIRSARGFTLTPAVGKADADGTLRFTVTADGNAKFGRGVIVVKNADGRTQRRTIDLNLKRVTEQRIQVHADGDLVVGFPCRFQITGGAPSATLDCQLAGTPQAQSVKLDDAGQAAVTFTPQREGTVRVRVGDEFAVGSAQALNLRPDRRVATVGERLGLDLRGNGLYRVNVLRGGELLHTATTRVQDGSGRLEIPLTREFAGVLTIHARRDKTRGTNVCVLVLRASELTVTTKSDRDVYRPGDTANIDVRTTDAEGKGVVSALGYWAVDEAVLALKNWKSGYETVFATLPAKASTTLTEAAESGSSRRIRSALGDIQSGTPQGAATIRHKRLPRLIEARDKLIRKAFNTCEAAFYDAYYEVFDTIPFREIRTFGSYRQQIAWMVRHGHIKPGLLVDSWGSPLQLREDRTHEWFLLHTNGPDLRPATHDDITGEGAWYWDLTPARMIRFRDLVDAHLPSGHPMRMAPFSGATWNSTIGLGGGAGGSWRGRGGSRNLRHSGGTRYAPAPTRRDFPPTLVFVPELLTGPDGRATLSIPMADSITTWRMRLVASSADGGTGVHVTKLRVSQPLHLDPWLAPHLTDGDTLDLPVSVRNETDAAIEAEVKLDVSPHLRIVGDSRATIEVEARGTGAHTFRIRAVKAGKATVRIETFAGDERDAVARIVHVRPNAQEVVKTVSTQIDTGSAWTPKLGRPGPGRLRLDLYPSPLADTVAGVDGLIREPHG